MTDGPDLPEHRPPSANGGPLHRGAPAGGLNGATRPHGAQPGYGTADGRPRANGHPAHHGTAARFGAPNGHGPAARHGRGPRGRLAALPPPGRGRLTTLFNGHARVRAPFQVRPTPAGRRSETPHVTADRSQRARAVRRLHLLRAFEQHGTSGAVILLRVGLVLGLLWLALFVSGIGVVAAGAYYAYQRFSENLPEPNKLIDRVATYRTSYIYDRNGKLLYELYNPDAGRRTIIPYEEFSPYLIWATVATEDANFFYHEGFDTRAILRALYQNYSGGRVSSGASTITQQLVRNVFFDVEERYELSYERKIREAILAYRVTQTYSKEQILQMYLNEVSYGNLQYGAEAASQFYFGKSAKDLNLAEAATLAGIPANPNEYNPLTDPVKSKARRNEVLDLLERNGYAEGGSVEHVGIPYDEIDAARQADLKVTPPDDFIQAPHWVWYVRDTLERRFGKDWIYQCGCDVQTTLDLDFQNRAIQEANDHLDKIRSLNANNAAVVAIDPHTGEILAMVGSANYNDPKIDGQVNVAIADRQPGSTLKPFTYMTAMDKFGLTAASTIQDEPLSVSMGQGLPPWRPHNHDLRFHGRVTVRQALARSLNIPPVKVLEAIGIPALLDTLHRAGVTSLNDPNRYGLAVTLGGGEVKLVDLTFAYSAIANNGLQIGAPVPDAEHKDGGMREFEPVAIKKITKHDTGQVVYEYRPPPGKLVLSPQSAYSVISILTDDRSREGTYGRHSFLELSRPAVAKTGTTDDYRDGWTMGFTPDLVVGVWVGNTNNAPMKSVYGVSGAGYIWHNVMEAAFRHFNMPERQFERPEGMVMVPVDFDTGRRTGPGPGAVDEWFAQGREPAMFANPRLFPDDFKREIAAGGLLVTPAASPSPAAAPAAPVSRPLPTATLRPTATPLPNIQPPPAPSPAVAAAASPVSAAASPVAATAAPAAPKTNAVGAARTIVAIAGPSNGERVKGQVYVTGTASMPNIRYYKVEFTSTQTPGWHQMGSLRQGPVYDSPLEVWNTAGLPAGSYQIMVTAVDGSGNWQQSAPVTVTLTN